ncbi:MAG: aspartate aminotransferase family protein [Thermoanaerobaculia bacterium]|nr:aspartate aminotransferase family protein [Thermoanaerobaculia bacterium]
MHPEPARRLDADPSRPDLDEFRRAGVLALDAIAEYHATLARRPVLPAVTPSGVAALFDDDLPETGTAADELVADWQRRVLPNLTAVGSPRHFAYVNGCGTLVGVLADALAGAAATNAGAWRLGPAAAEVERQTIRWIARFVGYPEAAGGLFVSGGTVANFTALTAALRHGAPRGTLAYGLQSARRRGRFLLYMSDHEGHASVTRVADLMNLGRAAVRRVPSRPDLTIDPAALERMLAADRRRGDLPFAVVAQLGSVNVGAVDPLEELAEVCSRHGVWLHGDGACGLWLAGVPETRDLFRGLERLDSVSVDAHKLLGVPCDCGLLMVREPARLAHAFALAAPYLGDEVAAGIGGRDFLELGPQMSRGFRALKVWMTLRWFGAEGLRRQLARQVALACHLHRLVTDHPDFEVLHEPRLFLYCFRFLPHALAGRRGEPAAEALLDELNRTLADQLQRSGLALAMTSRLGGRTVLRFSICSHRTREEDLDRTFAALARLGRALVPDTLARLPQADRVA